MVRQHLYISIAIIFILIAALLRLYELEGFITFLGDQGRDAIIIREIVTLEDFPAIGAPSSVGQVYLGPFYYYLVAPFLLLSNFNPVGLGYGVAILSICGTILSFFIIQKYFGKLTALLFLGITAVSYPLIELSRFSWNPNLLPIFSFATIVSFQQWLEKRTVVNAVVFGSLMALVIQLHHLALLLLIPTGLVLFYKLSTLKPYRMLLLQLGASAASFVFFTLPLILFDIKHNFLNSRNFINLFTSDSMKSGSSYIVRLGDTISNFLTHILRFELPLWADLIIILSLCFGFYLTWRKTRSQLFMFFGLTWTLFLFGFALIDSSRHLHYYGPIYLIFFAAFSYPIVLIESKKLRYFIGVTFLLIWISINTPNYHFLWNHPNDQIAKAREIAESFNSHITSEPIQLVSIPFTESNGHYRYFLVNSGYDVLDDTSAQEPSELFVLCFQQECNPLGDPQWQIAAFTNKQLESTWTIQDVTIYKIVHGLENNSL